MRKSKVFVSYTGFNEAVISLSDFNAIGSSKNSKQIIFRGKYNLESGLDFFAKASFFNFYSNSKDFKRINTD